MKGALSTPSTHDWASFWTFKLRVAASFTTPGGQDPAWEQREQGPAAARDGCLLWGGTAVWATGQALTRPTVPVGTVPSPFRVLWGANSQRSRRV